MCSHCADEETPARRNIQFIYQDGPSRDACRPGSLQYCERQPQQPTPVRQPFPGVTTTTSTLGESKESSSPTVHDRRWDHRSNSRGGTSIENELAQVSRSVERVRLVMGGVAPARKRIARGSSRELGASREAERNESLSRMGSTDAGCDVTEEERSCVGCGGMLQRCMNACGASVNCDGQAHVGDRSLSGQLCFACYACGLDFCVPCALSLQSTVGAKVVRIKLRYHEKDGLRDPTLKLGWVHAVSREGVAGSGPQARRDHGNLVARATYDAVKLKCEVLEQRLEEIKVGSCAPALGSTPSPLISGTTMQSRLRSITGSCEPHQSSMNTLCGSSGRERQEKYCTTQVIKLRAELEDARMEFKNVKRGLEECAGFSKAQAVSLQEQLRAQKNWHIRALELQHQSDTRVHEAIVERVRDRLMAQVEGLKVKVSCLEDKHAKETESLQAEVAQWRAHCDSLEQQLAECQRGQQEAIEGFEREKAKLQKAHAKELRRVANDSRLNINHILDDMEKATEEEAWALNRRATYAERQADSLGKQLQRTQEEVSARDVLIYGEGSVRIGRPKHGLESRIEALENALEQLRARLCLSSNKLPETQVGDDTHSNTLFSRNVQFVSAALAGRDPRVIASSLQRNGQLATLLDQRILQPFVKKMIASALSILQKHWSARHAVILMQEVHTSRSEFDALRHLLSFTYSREDDSYRPIKVWTNKFDQSDALCVPTLAARGPREKERAIIYAKCGVASSDDGIFSGVACLEDEAARYVAHYWSALDPRVQAGGTELLLVLTGDATGGWRGDAVTHGELGIGSWAKGKAQSRLTLLPLFLFEGDDSADNLRNRASSVATAFNKLRDRGWLTVMVNNEEKQVPVKLLVAADFQFFKAAMNMSKYTSAVWCLCGTDNLFRRPPCEVQSWQQALQFYDSIGCKLKDVETICELNHYSYEVLKGRPFKPFSCRCGWNSGLESQWRAAMEAHAQLEGDALKAAELQHSSMPEHLRHKPFNPPLFHVGTKDMSADVLHLVFINMFSFFFEMTILIHVAEFEPSAREPVEVYLRHIGLPLKVVKAKDVQEMKQSLTGRDAKVIISHA